MKNTGRLFFVATILSAVCAGACVFKATNQSSVAANEYGGHVDYYGPIPANLDKQISCPGVENFSAENEINGQRYVYKSSDAIDYSDSLWQQRAPADWNALSGLNLGNMEVVVIDIRRISGKPHYFYLSNGTQSKLYEPWSSSKFMTAAAAGAKARLASGGKVGLDAWSGVYNLGDMISAMDSYLPFANVPKDSNQIALYFLMRAGRSFATSLFTDWLKISDNSSLNGGYNETQFATGSDLWKSPTGASVAMADTREPKGGKEMSALAVAEFLKRITQHAADVATAMPNLTNDDVRVLLYGNAKTTGKIGGMLAGNTVYMAEGLMGGQGLGRYVGGFGGPENEAAKKYLDAATGGRWRIFQKSGLGYSSSRRVFEATMASYACLPGFNGGREFVIASSARGYSKESVDKMTTAAFNKIVPLLVPGFAPR